MTTPHTDPESHTRNDAGQAFTITASDGAPLRATRFGNPNAVLTVVYLHAPLSRGTYFSSLISELDQSYGGPHIAQLTYDQRSPGTTATTRTSRAEMAQLVDDVTAVLAHINGRVVLVVHSLAAILLQEWLYHGRHDEPLVHAIVAIAPVTELPDHTRALTANPTAAADQATNQLIVDLVTALGVNDHIQGEAVLELARQTLLPYRRCGADVAVVEDLLRATPTWVVVGRADRIAGFSRVEEFAATVWAELIDIEDAAHDLVHTHPSAATEVVLDALFVVDDPSLYGDDT
ncbi:alpha/beta fold hydrolase [Nocardia sp. NPDC058518]|uniref:alpha/beta fold hydrolase n=1 Tax=Nocardia sp. NPDC058518 TaxID=3346534 RepID=UPI00365DE5AF